MEKEGRWDDGRPGRFRLDKSKPLLINKGLLLSNRNLPGRPSSHLPSFSITQGNLHYGNNEYLCRGNRLSDYRGIFCIEKD